MKKSKINFRTDMASESFQMNNVENKSDLFTIRNVDICKTIVDEKISKKVGKNEGIYYEMDLKKCDILDTDDIKNIEYALADILREIIRYEGIDINNSKCLIVGLGNINVTPDSLGPLVSDNVIVTRHMFTLDEESISEGINNVCTLSPGVMGTTGIETSDIIDAVIKKIDLDYVIVVDALASREISKVNRCIQISNAGIHPGSGVGNRRKEFSKECLGIPVIAIGVPTVVDAVTISLNTIDRMLEFLIKKSNLEEKQIENYKKEYLGAFSLLEKNEKESLIYEVLKEEGLNMLVTPKDVDLDLKNLSEIVSSGIDRAIHPIIERE